MACSRSVGPESCRKPSLPASLSRAATAYGFTAALRQARKFKVRMTSTSTNLARVLASLLAVPLLAGLMAGCKLTKADPTAGTTLEIAVFEGGYGIQWHKQVARDYEKLHPGIKVNVWGDPRVDEKIRPRVLRGDPPDAAKDRKSTRLNS